MDVFSEHFKNSFFANHFSFNFMSHPQETCCYVEAHRIPGDEYSLHDSYTGELFSLNYAAHLQKLLTYPGMIKSSPL